MSLTDFEHIPIRENGDLLVELSLYDFLLEPVYFNQGVSKDRRIFLRKTVAEKLEKIQKDLNDCKFKIWDGYRPRSVQQSIYERFWKELQTDHPEWDNQRLEVEVGIFVTAPYKSKRIPPHATGGSVDLTLTDSTGKELNMGTSFDHFGPESASLYFESRSDNSVAKANRKLLREVMLSQGFNSDTDEWWHFDYGNQKWAAELGHPEAVFGECP